MESLEPASTEQLEAIQSLADRCEPASEYVKSLPPDRDILVIDLWNLHEIKNQFDREHENQRRQQLSQQIRST